MINELKYRGYTITHNPKPIPLRSFDWDFAHDDYDGAVDSKDDRCGSVGSEAAAVLEIQRLTKGEESETMTLEEALDALKNGLAIRRTGRQTYELVGLAWLTQRVAEMSMEMDDVDQRVAEMSMETEPQPKEKP